MLRGGRRKPKPRPKPSLPETKRRLRSTASQLRNSRLQLRKGATFSAGDGRPLPSPKQATTQWIGGQEVLQASKELGASERRLASGPPIAAQCLEEIGGKSCGSKALEADPDERTEPVARTSEWYKGTKMKLEPRPPEMLFRIMFVVRAVGGPGEERLQVQNCCQWKREERKIPAGVWLRSQDSQGAAVPAEGSAPLGGPRHRALSAEPFPRRRRSSPGQSSKVTSWPFRRLPSGGSKKSRVGGAWRLDRPEETRVTWTWR